MSAERFTTERRVEFCETDAAGIAHFSSLFQYMEQAEHAFLRSLGLSVFQNAPEPITWPRVHVEADFLGPAKFEDTLTISVRILKLGQTSIQYGMEITSTRGPVATGQIVAVCCRMHPSSNASASSQHEHLGASGTGRDDCREHKPLEKVRIPERIRELLTPFLAE